MMQTMIRIGSYEPPLSEIGSKCKIGQEDFIAPGVRGYAVESKGRVYVPLIIAEKPGSGAVGRFLDSLSLRCVIPSVTSARLRGMLDRRGWYPIEEGGAKVWVR